MLLYGKKAPLSLDYLVARYFWGQPNKKQPTNKYSHFYRFFSAKSMRPTLTRLPKSQKMEKKNASDFLAISLQQFETSISLFSNHFDKRLNELEQWQRSCVTHSEARNDATNRKDFYAFFFLSCVVYVFSIYQDFHWRAFAITTKKEKYTPRSCSEAMITYRCSMFILFKLLMEWLLIFI